METSVEVKYPKDDNSQVFDHSSSAAAMEHTVMMPFMYTIKINGKNRITAQDKALCGIGKVQSLYLAH